MTGLLVSEVMNWPVVTAAPDTPFKELVDLLAANRISAVPVTDGSGRPVGVVSERELLARYDSRAEGPQPGFSPLRAAVAAGRERGAGGPST